MPVGISYRAMLAAAGSSAAADAYIVNSFAPPVVADFAGVLNSGTEYYRVGGSDSTFDSMFTFSRSGLATMTDSDGNLKWAPHNVITYSEDYLQWAHTGAGTFADATLSNGVGGASKTKTGAATDYCKYFVRDLSNAVDIVSETSYTTSTTTAQYESVTFTTPSGCTSIRVSGQRDSSVRMSYVDTIVVDANTDYTLAFWHQVDAGNNNHLVGGYHIYKSSLGGMVDNPDNAISGGGKYVPTSGAAVYQARRNHYRYNGTSYVNKGILLESEARTNLITSSDDMSGWTTNNMTVAKNQTGADGVANSAHSLTATSGSATVLTTITAASNPHVYSALVKRITGTGTIEMTVNGGSTWVNVTSLINSSEFIQVGTGAGTTVTNPQVGFRITTSGDAIAVQVNQLEQTSGQFSSPIPTSGATVTRAAETLTIAAAEHGMTTNDVSLHVQSEITFADDVTEPRPFYNDVGDRYRVRLKTNAAFNGEPEINIYDGSSGVFSDGPNNTYEAGLNVPVNIAGRLDRGVESNIAYSGTAATADSYSGTPDYSTVTFQIGATSGDLASFNFQLLRIWSDADIGDTGIESATS